MEAVGTVILMEFVLCAGFLTVIQEKEFRYIHYLWQELFAKDHVEG